VIRAFLTVGATALLALAVVACGDDDGDSGESAGSGYGGAGVETTTEATETTTEATTANGGGAAGGGAGGEPIDIVETDFAIDPAKPTAEAGEVTFAISNDGDTVHNLEVEGNGVEEVSDDVDAGQRTELTVDLEPGSYELYCAIPGHEELGMTGELTVE
jgi:uncharacterized cupredoxin-like copper-binding protein